MKKSIIMKLTASVTALTIAFSQMFATVHAIEPDAEITTANILELLDEYDPDGAYIIRYNGGLSSDNTLFWFGSAKRIIDQVATAVHEDLHTYSFYSALSVNFYSENIYIGNKCAVNVGYTDVFPSCEMSREIPEDLRTFRFDTYVGEESTASSNDKGVYGLMNEFTSYCWDLNNTICLYDYYKTCAGTRDDWIKYANLIGNGRMAYSEFNYYILNYLKFAKENYPETYNSLLNNTDLVQSYIFIENKFSTLFDISEQYLSEINTTCDTTQIIDYFAKDYSRLIKETEKSEYQEIYNEVLAASGIDKNDPSTYPAGIKTEDNNSGQQGSNVDVGANTDTSGGYIDISVTTTTGDINRDGKVDSADILALIKYLTGVEKNVPDSDINQDGTVNVLDLIYLKYFLLN